MKFMPLRSVLAIIRPLASWVKVSAWFKASVVWISWPWLLYWKVVNWKGLGFVSPFLGVFDVWWIIVVIVGSLGGIGVGVRRRD